MMNRRLLGWIIGAPVMTLAVAGCGTHAANVSAPHHTAHHHSGGSAPASSPSVSPSVSTSVSTSTSTSTAQSVPVSNNPNPQPVLSTAPSGGGVGNTTGIRASVNKVTAEGTVSVGSATDNLYLVNMTLKNVTTSMIPFALSDVVVAANNASSSRNDYSMKGITQQNSLFPYPIVPSHAQAVVVMVQSNQTVSGDFTVEVPQASQYAVRISGSPSPIATFSS